MNLLMTFISILIVMTCFKEVSEDCHTGTPTKPPSLPHLLSSTQLWFYDLDNFMMISTDRSNPFLSLSFGLSHSDFNKMSNCIGSTLACVIGINNSFSFSVRLSFKRSSCVLENVESVRERRNWRDFFFLSHLIFTCGKNVAALLLLL